MCIKLSYCWWFRNSNVHQLREQVVEIPFFYKVLYESKRLLFDLGISGCHQLVRHQKLCWVDVPSSAEWIFVSPLSRGVLRFFSNSKGSRSTEIFFKHLVPRRYKFRQKPGFTQMGKIVGCLEHFGLVLTGKRPSFLGGQPAGSRFIYLYMIYICFYISI